MRRFFKIAGALLTAALLLGGCQSSKEKYTIRETGIEQLNAGSFDEAIRSFDQALEHSDGLVGAFELDVLKYRAEAEYKTEDYKAAAHTYEILIQADELRPEYVDMQNMLYIKAGELDQAMEAYQSAREKAAQSKDSAAVNETVLLSLGEALTKAERFDDARALYQQAVSDGVQSGELYNRMGLCELEDENPDQALEYFSQGILLQDEASAPRLLYNQAAAYEQKLDFAKALELLEHYVSTYGITPEVEKEIAFLKSR